MNFNYEQLNVMGDTFLGYVKEGKIYNNAGGLIGRTEDEYQKAIKTAEEFQEVLYNHNILERPKTPEQQNKELQEQLLAMTQMMSEMQQEMKQMKGNSNAETNGNGHFKNKTK